MLKLFIYFYHFNIEHAFMNHFQVNIISFIANKDNRLKFLKSANPTGVDRRHVTGESLTESVTRIIICE